MKATLYTFLTGLLIFPSIAFAQMGNSNEVFILGPIIPAWVALVSGILIIIFALHMRGGKIMWPFMLLGLGQLFDAAVGLVPSPEQYAEFFLYLGPVFNLVVLIAVIWIGSLFGVIQKKRPSKPVSTPQASQSPNS